MKAIIIGASSGIGKALALTLSAQGFTLGLMARRMELLQELSGQISTQTHIGYLDVSKVDEAMVHFQNMLTTLSDIDLVIFNSGVGYVNPTLDWNLEKQTIDVNVTGFCALATLAMNYFLKRGSGHFVSISSIAALRGNSPAPAYNASKAFMSNYMQGLRKKAFESSADIVVTDIKPGFVDTDMIKGKKQFWVASTKEAANQIYQAITKKKDHAYITHRWRLIAWANRLLPTWLYHRIK